MLREISGGSKKKAKFPKPSAEETALQKEQVTLLRQQREILEAQMREQELLAPFLYKAAGISPKFNEAGEIIGFDEIPDEFAEQRRDIEKGFLDRTLAAQRGELPVDPALMRDLREQEQTLGEVMRRQLGPGWESSSAGIEAMQKFNESSNVIKEGARRGDLTLGEQLGLAREMANSQQTNQYLARLANASGRDSGTLGGLFQTSQGYNSPLQALFANRQGQFGARMANFNYDMYADPFTWRGFQRNIHQGAMAFLGGASGSMMGGGGGGGAF